MGLVLWQAPPQPGHRDSREMYGETQAMKKIVAAVIVIVTPMALAAWVAVKSLDKEARPFEFEGLGVIIKTK